MRVGCGISARPRIVFGGWRVGAWAWAWTVAALLGGAGAAGAMEGPGGGERNPFASLQTDASSAGSRRPRS